MKSKEQKRDEALDREYQRAQMTDDERTAHDQLAKEDYDRWQATKCQ